MIKIESVSNPYIKEVYKLHEKKYRDLEKKFLVEGEHLVLEAYKTNHLIAILYSDERYAQDGVKNIFVTDKIIEKLAFTKTPQKVIGVCNYLLPKKREYMRYLLLDDIQDPGNLGTLVRSSLGFNIDKVILSKNSVDLYNDKFIRASQGSIFHLDIEILDLENEIYKLKENNIAVYGTSLEGGYDLNELIVPQKYAIILGNEGSGIKKEILSVTTKNIYIETNPFLESLNVGVAGSIILHYFNSKQS